METSNNGQGVKSSGDGVNGNKSALLKGQHNAPSCGRLSSLGKSSSVRKMSTMPEEEGSDDMEPDVIRIISSRDGNHHFNQHHGQDPADSDTPSETERERGRLLSSGSRKIVITPASIGSVGSSSTTIAPTSVAANGVVKRSSSGNSSTDSVHEKFQPAVAARQQLRLAALEPEARLYRENSGHGYSTAAGRLSRGVELHGGSVGAVPRHHRYPSMRSLKSNATEDHQHNHPPATSWASIVFSDAHSQSARPFPDSVSIRSLASIGMGSSDGRKLTIRRVPTSPSELLNMVHPPT